MNRIWFVMIVGSLCALVWINPENEEEISLPEIKDDKINTEDTWSSEKINDELNVLNRTRANSIVGESSGEMVVLNDSNKSLFGGIRLFGKTEQFTTTGAQLLDVSKMATQSSGGLTSVFNADGSITVNGTPTIQYAIASTTTYLTGLEPGTYYISGGSTNGGCVVAQINRSLSDGTTKHTSNGAFTVDGTETSIRLNIQTVSAGLESVNNYTIYPMLNKGSTPLPYEPYTGGIPSPNPQYPQELVSVGDDGDVEVWVYGKNLLDVSSMRIETNVSLDIDDDGYTITAVGGSNKTYSKSLTEVAVECLLGKTVYFHADSIEGNDSRNQRAQVTIITKSGATSYYSIAANNLYSSFEVPKDAVSMHVSVFTNNTNSLFESDITTVVKGLRLTLKPNSEWEPYKAKQTLLTPTPNGLPGIKVTDASLATYTDESGQMWCADEIDFKRGVYVKRIEHVVLDGDKEMWRTQASNTGASYFILRVEEASFAPTIKVINPPMLSSVGSVNYRVIDENGYGLAYAYGVRVRFENMTTDNATVDEFKAYLAQNPIEIMYAIATPIETPLSKEELTAYRALHSNYPVTTILNDSGTYMNVKYNIDTQTYLDAKFTEVKSEFNEKHDVLKDDVETLKTDISNTNKTANSNKKRIEVLEDYSSTRGNAIIRTSDGEIVVFSDSSDDPLRGLRVFGKTEQFTTTGAQLFDVSKIVKPSSTGLTTITNSDGSLTINGTPSQAYAAAAWCKNIQLEPGTYYVSGGANAVGCVYAQINIRSSDGTFKYYLNKTFEITGTEQEVTLNIQSSGDLSTINNYTIYPMLNKGSTPLPYEPYTGGIPSPNPQYPQRLKTIGKSKNLFDLDSCTFGYIKSDGTLLREESNRTTDFIEIPLDVSAVSISANSAMKSYSISFWDSSKNHISTEYTYSKQTHTWGDLKNAKYVRIGVSIDNTPIGDRLPSCSIMINYGNASLPYEPYGKNDIEVGVCGKNLLKITATTKTINGVTFTVNDDGSVTVNGTATANASFALTPSDAKSLVWNFGRVVLSGNTISSSISEFRCGFVEYPS